MSSRTNSIQLARFLNGQNVSNSIVLAGDLVGVLIQHPVACDMKLQASFDNVTWWDVTTNTGSVGAPIAGAVDRKFLTVPTSLQLSGTLLRILATAVVTVQTDCWVVVAND
jgi:hypothetical protein